MTLLETLIMSTSEAWSYLKSLGVQHRKWDDPFFVEGHSVCSPLRKIPCLDLDDEDFLHCRVAITCNVAGCNRTFSTVAEHASHQRTCHTHVCSTCRQTLPSHHLLDLHLLEVHDTLFQLMAERKPMYQCFLETCCEKFSNTEERKSHCVAKHNFPTDFRFDRSWRKQGKSKQKSVSDRTEASSEMECEAALPVNVGDSDTLISECSVTSDKHSSNNKYTDGTKFTHKLPSSVSFGAGVPRGFCRWNRGRRGRGRGRSRTPHWHQRTHPSNVARTNIDEVNMKDLEQALPGE